MHARIPHCRGTHQHGKHTDRSAITLTILPASVLDMGQGWVDVQGVGREDSLPVSLCPLAPSQARLTRARLTCAHWFGIFFSLLARCK